MGEIRVPHLGDHVLVSKDGEVFTATVCAIHHVNDPYLISVGCLAHDGVCFPCTSVDHKDHAKEATIFWYWDEEVYPCSGCKGNGYIMVYGGGQVCTECSGTGHLSKVN